MTIHETAFVTCTYRAWGEELSRDRFARLWMNTKTEEHAQRYAEAVSKFEPLAHCLRNRYFYEKIKALHVAGEIAFLINFGCGFSMYPFLLPETLIHIEIDQADVIDHKKEKVAKWQREGNLPAREIHYIKADFNQTDFGRLLQQIMTVKKDGRSLILLEGVLFFLAPDDTERLFALFSEIQKSDEYVGSVSFTRSLEETEVFKKLIRFVEANLEKNQKFQYQTVPHSFYEDLKGYELVEHKDTLGLNSAYGQKEPLPAHRLLNEQMYLLSKR